MVLIVIIGLSLACKMRMLHLGRMQMKTYLTIRKYVSVTFIHNKTNQCSVAFFISSSGPKAHRRAYSIPMVRRPSSVRPQFQTSPPKPLGQLKLNFIWNLIGKRGRKFVCGIWVTRPRWPPFPCMVKTLQTLLLRNR